MSRLFRTSIALLALAGATLLAGCERPPVDVVQHGFRGTGMQIVYNPRTLEGQIPANQPPEAAPAASADGPKAKDVYQNVKVLGDLSIAQFNRHMAAITQWVSPKEGCTYCHVGENFADDGKYTKVVARRMIQMTQNVNANWQTHVAATGVTCYTCHRGNPVPANVWFKAPPQDNKSNFIGDRDQQNAPAKSVGLSSLPNDPFSDYFAADPKTIRVIGKTALPSGNLASTKQTEHTYGLMMHMSTSLGVNCTYCHNSRSFASWEGPPQRATAWYGIRMVRDLNNDYLTPLTGVFPPNRLGPTGDVAKVYCTTCHQGASKPLYGAQMAKDYPELLAPSPAASAPALTPKPVARGPAPVEVAAGK